MSGNDTERLLRECDAGTRMAAGSIRNLLCKVENAELRELLCETLKTHEKLGNDIHAMLNNVGEPAKEPSRMAQAMTKMKVEMKTMQEDADHAVAEMLIDGCNMGIKKLSEYINTYETAEKEAKDIAKRLVDAEQGLMDKLRLYL